MGHELYRMILDGAPAGWTAPMRLVAAVIADDARDPSQGLPDDGGWPWSAIPVCGCRRKGEWRDGLTEQTGMSERAISRALTELARAGYEMREQVTADRRGRPVFAYPGRAMRFRVPQLLPRECPPSTATTSPPSTATIGADGSSSTDARQVRRPLVAKSGHLWSPSTATPSPQGPPIVPPASQSSVVNSYLEGTHDGQTGDIETERSRQEKALAEWIRDHPQPDDAQPPGSTR